MCAVQGLDLSVKNFLTSVPLVADLRSPAMRERHWTQLMTTTKVHFLTLDTAPIISMSSAAMTSSAAFAAASLLHERTYSTKCSTGILDLGH